MTIMNNERKLGMKILIGKDHPESFLMLETGRAEAEANDDILLAAQVATSKAPVDFAVSKEAMSVEPYGIMMRKNDMPFKKSVDEALRRVYQSDEIQRIYKKWFMSPIPPRGVNLNFRMPAKLKAALAKPTDSPDPAAYR